MLSLRDLTVERSFDAQWINTVLNHPDVFFDAGGCDEVLDVSGVVSNPENYLLRAKGGGLIFHKSAAGLYQVHTQFLPNARGRSALRAARDALSYMFLATDAMEVATMVAEDNRSARQFCRSTGLTYQFGRAEALPSAAGLKDVRFYRLEFWDWLWSQNWLSEVGAWFHEKLHSAQDRLGLMVEHHPADDAHNRVVGAMILMGLFGQPDKAVILYNRWAGMAGYQPVQLLHRSPLIIDINECSIYLADNKLEVISCPVQ